MSRSSLVLICVFAVASLAGEPVSQARRTVAPQAANFSREWFLVPLFVVNEVVERIKDGTITEFVYDPTSARLVKAAS